MVAVTDPVFATEPAAALLFCVIVAMVLFSYRVHSALRDRLGELENLYGLTKRMSSARSVDAVVGGLLVYVAELMHAERALPIHRRELERDLLQIALGVDGTTIETTTLTLDSETAPLGTTSCMSPKAPPSSRRPSRLKRSEHSACSKR